MDYQAKQIAKLIRAGVAAGMVGSAILEVLDVAVSSDFDYRNRMGRVDDDGRYYRQMHGSTTG